MIAPRLPHCILLALLLALVGCDQGDATGSGGSTSSSVKSFDSAAATLAWWDSAASPLQFDWATAPDDQRSKAAAAVDKQLPAAPSEINWDTTVDISAVNHLTVTTVWVDSDGSSAVAVVPYVEKTDDLLGSRRRERSVVGQVESNAREVTFDQEATELKYEVGRDISRTKASTTHRGDALPLKATVRQMAYASAAKLPGQDRPIPTLILIIDPQPVEPDVYAAWQTAHETTEQVEAKSIKALKAVMVGKHAFAGRTDQGNLTHPIQGSFEFSDGGQFSGTMEYPKLDAIKKVSGDLRVIDKRAEIAAMETEAVKQGTALMGIEYRLWLADDGKSVTGVWVHKEGSKFEQRGDVYLTLDP